MTIADAAAQIIEQIDAYREYARLFIFLTLAACGFGLPISKDAFLLASGMISGLGSEASWQQASLMWGICFSGTLIGDCIMFGEGRLLAKIPDKIPFISRVLTKERLAKIQAAFAKLGIMLLVVARFTPVIRGPIYIFCGFCGKMFFAKFLAANGVLTLVYCGIWVFFGHWCAKQSADLSDMTGIIIAACLSIAALALISALGIHAARKLARS